MQNNFDYAKRTMKMVSEEVYAINDAKRFSKLSIWFNVCYQIQ